MGMALGWLALGSGNGYGYGYEWMPLFFAVVDTQMNEGRERGSLPGFAVPLGLGRVGKWIY